MRRIALVLVLLAVAGLTAASTLAPKPKPSIAGLVIGDTVFVRGTWRSLDARGNPVAQYNYRYLRNGLEAASGTTADTLVVRPFSRPLAGDTAEYVIEVVAVDVRGIASSAGRSPVLRVITPWTPPAPPVVRIDTVAYQPGTPDGLTMYIAPPTWGGMVTISDDQLTMAVGDTVTICALRWTGGYATMPAEPVKWSTDRSDVVLLEPRTSNCALATALLETTMGVTPWPTRVARP